MSHGDPTTDTLVTTLMTVGDDTNCRRVPSAPGRRTAVFTMPRIYRSQRKASTMITSVATSAEIDGEADANAGPQLPNCPDLRCRCHKAPTH